MTEVIEDIEYKNFIREIRLLTEIDLTNYKAPQMIRRLNSLMNRMNIPSFSKYVDLLKSDKVKLQEFKDYITINVTEFFRNPDKWQELKTAIMPELISSHKLGTTLKIWSAGSSSGVEAYSLAMMMRKSFPATDYTIIGTDIDNNMLKKASSGIYNTAELKGIDEQLLKENFTAIDHGSFQINANLKKNVSFKHGNLLLDNFDTNFDLILCRNVVIYFTEAAKSVLYHKFYNALRDNGVFFVGSTESILNARDIGFKSKLNFFYQK